MGDDFLITGRKLWITNANEADVFIVFATTDRSLGFRGLCAFVLERGAPGLEIGPAFSKMGLRTSHLSEMFFSDCHVPTDAMLGAPGGGMARLGLGSAWRCAFYYRQRGGRLN